MDNRGRNPDRTDPLRSLSRAIARGASQVLQRHLLIGKQSVSAGKEGSGRGQGNIPSREVGPCDLTNRCEWCQKPLPLNARRSQEYCSSKCYNKAYWQLSAQARLTELAGRCCAGCGDAMPVQMHRNAKYCTPGCRLRHSPAAGRLLAKKSCLHCARVFRVRTVDQKYCNLSCAGRASYLAGNIKTPVRRRHLTAARFDGVWSD